MTMTLMLEDTDLPTPTRVQDVTAGRPVRIVAIPYSGLVDPVYYFMVTPDDKYGSTVLFTAGPAPLPTFELTGQETSQMGTLLVAAAPCGFDNTGRTTAVGWYRIVVRGTDPATTETVERLCGHGALLVRLQTTLVRRPSAYVASSGCGCTGGASTGCGCGAGCTGCDHPPLAAEDDCSILTSRARVKGRWRGDYTEFPSDGLGAYQRYDVVQMPTGRQYVYVGPADGVTACLAPGEV
jgi:hypothetical protein